MRDEDMRRMGTRIAEARRAAGLSQQEFARLLGASKRTIQYYEAGSPPYRHLHEIARLTRTSQSWLLAGDRPATPLAERLAEVRERLHEQADVLAHHLEVLRAQAETLEEHRKTPRPNRGDRAESRNP